MPPESQGKYFIARIRGGDVAAVGSMPEAAPPIAAWNTYIWVESADETAAKVARAGGTTLMEPFDVMDAGRMAVFADPEGAAFCVWQAKQHKGARDRQRSRLAELQRPQHPRPGDREDVLRRGLRLADAGARRRRSRCGRCPATATTSSATVRACARRMAEMGAPAGFEDVVASLNPIPDDQPDVPAHWSVTFAVDDADATARTAPSSAGRWSSRRSTPLGPHDRARRPAGRDVHREQVRPREPGHTQRRASVRERRLGTVPTDTPPTTARRAAWSSRRAVGARASEDAQGLAWV